MKLYRISDEEIQVFKNTINNILNNLENKQEDIFHASENLIDNINGSISFLNKLQHECKDNLLYSNFEEDEGDDIYDI